jgi:hypothetical protein
VLLVFNQKEKKNSKDNSARTAEAEEAPILLHISGPILPARAEGAAIRPASRASSRPSTSGTRWPVTQPRHALGGVEGRRGVELADNPIRRPVDRYNPPTQQYNETRQQQLLMQDYANLHQLPCTQNISPSQPQPQSPVELEVRHPARTYNAYQPLLVNQRNDLGHRPPPQPQPHYVKSDFADDSTIMGDKADITTLYSGTSLESDSEDGESVVGAFVPLPESEVGLHGDHWKARGKR